MLKDRVSAVDLLQCAHSIQMAIDVGGRCVEALCAVRVEVNQVFTAKRRHLETESGQNEVFVELVVVTVAVVVAVAVPKSAADELRYGRFLRRDLSFHELRDATSTAA